MNRAALALLLASCVTVPVKEPIGRDPPPQTSLPTGPISFELESLDDRSVSAPSFRGHPAVLAFLETDSMAGQAEATILASLAEHVAPDVHIALVALEPPERRELVQGFVRFFNDKSKAPILGAMADKDMLLGLGPFGDVRGLTVLVLDAAGKVVLRKSGVVTTQEIARALSTL